MSYQQILKPKDKIKRIFINFLTMIDKIPHSSSFQILLQQYKYASSGNSDSESVEIHANYLSLMRKQFNILQLCEQINQDISKIKEDCQKVKTQLEKQLNLAQNMEKVYMNKLK